LNHFFFGAFYFLAASLASAAGLSAIATAG